jgi:hypothetical protein
VFILCAILEYAVCLYIKRGITRRKRKEKLKQIKDIVAKVGREEDLRKEENNFRKEEQKLFVVRAFTENMVSYMVTNRARGFCRFVRLQSTHFRY